MSTSLRRLAVALCLGVAFLVGCDDGDPDEPADAAADATGGMDTAPEPEPDTAPEPEPDMAPEPEPDTAPEPEPDMAREPDMAPEPDMGPTPDMLPACADGETRPCAVDGRDDCAGVQTCSEGAFGPCAAPAEVCDGVDNDCDGVVDDVPGVGEPCTVGVGACAVEAVTACGPDGAVTCLAEPGRPADELCGSGVDEDCDGQVDEPQCIVACEADDGCAEGELCIDGRCLVADCRADDACGEGELCIANACRPATCRQDADCEPDEICADFDCAARPTACVDPIRVEMPGVFEGSTVDAPSQIEASCGAGARSPERVFAVDLGVPGPICLSTVGSGYDTALFVQASCGDPATELACNDDVGLGDLTSRIQLDGAAPVFAVVDGFGADSSGDFVFTVSVGECPCLGDAECGEDEVCRAGACAPVVCGDGAREGFEECDDGGIDPGDGCDDLCFVEGGFVCLPGPDGDRCRLEVCGGDGDCLAGEICDDGACVLGDCRDDGECGAGELCVDNICTISDCRDDADCGDGQTCVDGVCVLTPEACDNGVDDDGDGDIDCADDDCFDAVACPCPRDDIFEDDSDAYPGPLLPPFRIERLALCDDDIYHFVLCAGGTAVVTVEFSHAEGDIDAILGNAATGQEVDRGDSRTDDEVLTYTNQGPADVQLDILLTAGATGSAYAIDIQVFDCAAAGQEVCTNGVDDDGDGLVDCVDPACDGHPDCAAPPAACDAPIPLPDLGRFEGDTTGRPAQHQETDPACIDGEISAASSSEVAFAFGPGFGGEFCFSTLGSTFDTVLYVREGVCDDPQAEVACNDDNRPVAGGNNAALTLDADPRLAYYVFVDGFGGFNDGPFVLDVSAGPCAPPIEDCANGVNDDLDPRVDCEDPSCFGADVCLAANCGNGAVDPGETCDDGGRAPGDGCDDACRVEPGYICESAAPGQPSACRFAACGDGVVDAPELCDDGNVDGGDGCDGACTPEVYTALRGVERFTVTFPFDAGDTIAFEADAASTHVVARTGDGDGGCIGDTVLTLYTRGPDGARGEQVARNDDGGDNGLCSLLDAVVEPGLYDLVVTEFDGAGLRDVVVDLRVAGIISAEAGGSYAGAVPDGGDDLFEFELAEQARVTLETGDGAGGCPGDTVLTLFDVDADGGRVQRARNDDFDDACSRLVIDLPPGRYDVQIEEFGGAALRYALTVDLLYPECGDGVVEVAEECDDGNAINGDGCDALCTAEVYSALAAVEQFAMDVALDGGDAVRFTVDDDPSRLVARTSGRAGDCPGDTVIDIHPVDADGNRGPVIAGDDDGGPGACSLFDDALPPGDYALVVRGFNGASVTGVALDYRLEVAIDAGGRYDGAVAVGGTDLYVFELDAASAVTVETGDGAGGCPGDTDMRLFAVDDAGVRVMLERSDDHPDLGLCSRIALELEPGRYEVEVEEFARDAALAYVLDAAIGPPPARSVEVAIRGFSMEPDPLVIAVGTTVRWTNFDPAAHTVTSGEPNTPDAGAIFDSGDLAPGQSFEFTFDVIGAFTYFCRPHLGVMQGYTVVVEGG